MQVRTRRIRSLGRAQGGTVRLGASAPALAALALALAATLAPGPAASARSVSLSDLTFTTARLGWLRVSPGMGEAGTLYRTVDGGASWRVVSKAISATAVVFRNRLDGAALVPVVGSEGMCQVSLTAVTTTDGGVTWHDPAAIRAEDAPLALAFEGRTPVLLNASCAGPYGALQAPAGATVWRVLGRLALPARELKTFGSASVVSLTPSGSFAVVGYSTYGQPGAPLLRGYVHRAGAGVGPKSWHSVPIGSQGLPGHLAAVSFANARDGVVATANAQSTDLTLWATRDGGRTWSKAAVVAGDDQATLDLVNARVAYASVTRLARAGTSSRLLKSTDGGLAWAALRLPR